MSRQRRVSRPGGSASGTRRRDVCGAIAPRASVPTARAGRLPIGGWRGHSRGGAATAAWSGPSQIHSRIGLAERPDRSARCRCAQKHTRPRAHRARPASCREHGRRVQDRPPLSWVRRPLSDHSTPCPAVPGSAPLQNKIAKRSFVTNSSPGMRGRCGGDRRGACGERQGHRVRGRPLVPRPRPPR